MDKREIETIIEQEIHFYANNSKDYSDSLALICNAKSLAGNIARRLEQEGKLK